MVSTGQYLAQSQPRIATRSDGGAYIAWSLGLDSPLHLQRLNAGGVEQWPHGGIVIDDHPFVATSPEFDLRVAANGDALIGIADKRDGNDLDIQVLRYDASGHS